MDIERIKKRMWLVFWLIWCLEEEKYWGVYFYYIFGFGKIEYICKRYIFFEKLFKMGIKGVN